MFKKLLCALGRHDWRYIFLTPVALAPKYRYCARCLRQEQNMYNTMEWDDSWRRIEDYRESEAEILERIYKK